jgi:hypothetical protein
MEKNEDSVPTSSRNKHISGASRGVSEIQGKVSKPTPSRSRHFLVASKNIYCDWVAKVGIYFSRCSLYLRACVNFLDPDIRQGNRPLFLFFILSSLTPWIICCSSGSGSGSSCYYYCRRRC